MSAPSRLLAVCADDFGLSMPVSDTINALASGGRLTAVSCMVSGLAWPQSAPMAAAWPKGLLLGLHFDLTQHRPLSTDLCRHWSEPPPLGMLMLRAALGALPLTAIAAEWRAQLEAFVDVTGRAPDFVDGHQHVHHLRGLREALLSQLGPAVAVRNTGCLPGPGFALKRAAIAFSGGRALQRLLRAQGRAHNAALVGVYDFRHGDYRALVRRWLQSIPERGAMLVCHPGEGTDPIAPARRREARYLASNAFLQDLQAAGVGLGAAWAQSGAGREPTGSGAGHEPPQGAAGRTELHSGA